MPKFDSLGDRIKFYERQPAGEYLTPLLPIIIRLDGNNFHKKSPTLTVVVLPYQLKMKLLMFLYGENKMRYEILFRW